MFEKMIHKIKMKFNKSYREEYNSLMVKRKNIINIEIKALEELTCREASDYNDKQMSEDSSKNNKCPKCSSTDIVEKISRVNGSISGSGSGSFVFGCGSFDSRTSGSTDTAPVNSCRHCGNEWYKSATTRKWGCDILKERIKLIIWLLKDYDDLENIKYNPDDIDEIYNSLEEKQKALRDNFKNHKWYMDDFKKTWKGISIDTIEYLFKEKLYDNYYLESFNKYFKKYPNLLYDLGVKRPIIEQLKKA